MQFKESTNPNRIECYVDASYADGPGARSQTGYVFMMNGGPIAWASRLQQSVASSTMQAETAAAADAAKENEFLRDLCFEMGARQDAALLMYTHEDKVHPSLWNIGDSKPILYHEDNAACITYNHQINVIRRSRHMAIPVNFDVNEPDDIAYAKRHARVDYYLLRDTIADGEAEMQKVHTDLQIEDTFTKCLGAKKTALFRDMMLTHVPVFKGEQVPPGHRQMPV